MKSATPMHSEDLVISVELNPQNVIREHFLGFGVEWDSNAYDASGVTDQDFAIIRKRVEWMRLPITRIMMQARWCYQGNDRYDWDSPGMRSLYRHLDVCQKLGTTVVLAEWGIEPAWLKTPDVAKVEDPKYAGIISTYLDHLINKRGYTCIKYFTLVNEPNYEVKDWDRWKKGIQNVAAELRSKGLDRQIAIMGSDQSNADEWHRNAVDQLQNELGAYDIHCYAQEEMVRAGALHDYCKSNWDYALAGDPKAKDKPLMIGEAGFWMEGSGSANNPAHLDPEYGLLMADYAVQAATAGSWAVLAWMLDDNSHLNFTWGMCRNKADGLATKPWFHAWALLARTFPSGSTIVRAGQASKDVRILAAYHDVPESPEQRHWTFCIVNRADTSRTVRLRVINGSDISMKRTVYSATSSRTDQDGFPVALDHMIYNLDAGAEIRCEANSMVLLSSMDTDGSSVFEAH